MKPPERDAAVGGTVLLNLGTIEAPVLRPFLISVVWSKAQVAGWLFPIALEDNPRLERLIGLKEPIEDLHPVYLTPRGHGDFSLGWRWPEEIESK